MHRIAILVLAVWALLATAILLYRGAAPAPEPVHAVMQAPATPLTPVAPPPPAVDVAPLNAKIAALTDEVARLKKELIEARMVAAKPAPTKPAAATPLGPAGSQLDLGSLIEQALKQSGLAGAMDPAAAAARQNRLYAPLFAKLGLDEAKKAAFFKALASSQNRLGIPGETTENGQLKELLGAEGYAQWQAYEKTIGNREAVDAFEQRLLTSNLPLNEIQRSSLVDGFGKSGIGAPNVVELSMTAGQSGTQSLEGALDRKFNDWDALVADAKTYLSPAQAKELDRYLGERAEQHENLAKMANVTVRNIGSDGTFGGAEPGGTVSNFSVKIISTSSFITNGSGIRVPGATLTQ